MSNFKERSRKIARQRFWEEHDRKEYNCPDCGRSEDELGRRFEVHHKNGEPMDNRPENHIALCRLCHNLREGKKPSKKQIKKLRSEYKSENVDKDKGQKSTPSVYLAGSMDYNGEHQTWRASILNSRLNGSYDVLGRYPLKINSPTEVTGSHGCGRVDGVASDDMELIDDSDAILAYFNKKEQVGTLTELVYAVTEGKPALVIFNDDYLDDSMPLSLVEYKHQSPVYWFLINFLTCSVVEPDVEIEVIETRNEIKSVFRDWDWAQNKLPVMKPSEVDFPKESQCRSCGESFNRKSFPPLCDSCIENGKKL